MVMVGCWFHGFGSCSVCLSGATRGSDGTSLSSERWKGPPPGKAVRLSLNSPKRCVLMQDTGRALGISCSFLGVSEPAAHVITAETEVTYLVVGAQLWRGHVSEL